MKYIYQLISILIVSGNLLLADIPETLSYQGYLSENGVAVADGSYALTFTLHLSAGGGVEWTEEHNSVAVENGVFSVILGKTTLFSVQDIDFTAPLWLEMDYNGTTLGPIELTSSAYSMASKTSETASAVVGTENVFPSSGWVGIGTDPQRNLHIHAAGSEGDGNADLHLTNDATESSGYDGATITMLGDGGPGSGTDLLINNREAGNLLFHTNGTEKVRITSDGNVGIGEESPSSLLDVGGDINFSGNLLQNGSLVDLGDNTLWNTTGDASTTSYLNYDYSTGHVGIGIEADEDMILDVNGEVRVADRISLAGDLRYYSNNGFAIKTIGENAIIFEPDYANTAPAMIIEPDGDVGIGTTIPSYKLDVAGTIRGETVSESDIRWKKNIDPIEGSLEKVKQLQGVHYDWKDENKDQSRQIGFIAQDVEKIFPELVKTDEKGYKSMNYSKVVTVLVESVKELDDENRELEDRIVRLENMVETLLHEESSDKN